MKGVQVQQRHFTVDRRKLHSQLQDLFLLFSQTTVCRCKEKFQPLDISYQSKVWTHQLTEEFSFYSFQFIIADLITVKCDAWDYVMSKESQTTFQLFKQISLGQ